MAPAGRADHVGYRRDRSWGRAMPARLTREPRRRRTREWLVLGVCRRRSHKNLTKARREVKNDDPNRSSLYDAQRPGTGRFCQKRGASEPQPKTEFKLIAKK